MGTLLVERVGAANRDEPGSACVVPGTGRVSADADLADEPRGIALAHAVARRPDDARNHVERINHHLAAGDGEGVYGALVDLFIAFDGRAAGLRRRMLLGARHVLSAERFGALERGMASGLKATDPMEPALWSVLSAGVCGQPVVERLDEDAEPEPDADAAADARPEPPQDERREQRDRAEQVLTGARAAVRRGDVASATDQLEAAVIGDPANEALQVALVDLYRVTADAQRVRDLVTQLPPAAPAWRWHLLIEELSP